MKWIKESVDKTGERFVLQGFLIKKEDDKLEFINVKNWVNSQFVDVNRNINDEMLANYYSYGDLVKESVGELEQANKAVVEDEERLNNEEKERLRSLLRELREKEVKNETL